MTSAANRSALEGALKSQREGVSGSFVPLELQDPTTLFSSLDTIKRLEQELGLRPTDAQVREAEIEKQVSASKKDVEAARKVGIERGQKLFGDEALGRLDIGASGLTKASALAEQRATGGLTDEEAQILRERAERQISQSKESAIRQARGLAGTLGQDSETARARETRILNEATRANRDAAETIALADIQIKQQGLSQFGQFAGQQLAAQQVNLGQILSEKKGQISSEIAEIGLSQATRSLGVNQTLSAIALDFNKKAAEQQLGIQAKEANKPVPESGGGGTVVCTEARRLGHMSEALYQGDVWAVDLYITPEEMKGYHLWGEPAAWLMSKSNMIGSLFSIPAIAWAEHMNHLLDTTKKDNLFGRTMFSLGRPLCGLIGKALLWWEGCK